MTKAEIALIRSLTDKKERTAHGLFIAEGEKLVAEMAESVLTVRKIFRCREDEFGEGTTISYRNRSGENDNRKAGTTPLSSAAASAGRKNNPEQNYPGIETEVISRKEMERISALKTPAGVLALIEIPRYELAPDAATQNLVLALDNIQDPGNMGTILRLADWFGIRDIVCSGTTADCFNPKVVQATMGAIARIRVHYTFLPSWLKRAPAAGVPIYGTFLNGENIYSAALSHTGILIMGSEGKGISPEIERLVNRRLHIPPYPADNSAAESLNVAMATAIACSEFRRRG